MNVAEQLVARLEQHGVTTVFALPGEENLAVVEALDDSSITLVVVRHEQHAAFMAATHGRLTGRPGVCLATLGPGATNLFTGLAHAELGGMPLIAITGQKPIRDNAEGSFQVIDIPAAARPLTRWSTTVKDRRTIVSVIDEAFGRALGGRPGAVLVELPEDVAEEEAEHVAFPDPAPVPVVGPPRSIDDVVRLVDAAERPVVLAGAGANDEATSAALVAFAEATGIGILVTQMGKGAMPESHALSMRSLGIHRPDYSHLAIGPADVVIAIGYQPVEHPPLAWNPEQDKAIVHIAPWAASVERGYVPAEQIAASPAAILDVLADRLTSRDPSTAAASAQAISRSLEAEDEGTDFPPSPLRIARSVRGAVGPDGIVALDNGAYKIWFARHDRCESPNTLLLDNALATMGAGLATASEASRLAPESDVIAVCGDGGFLMNVQDLETACRLGLDLTVLVLRDEAYGFIGWHQEEQGRERTGVELGNPDLVALAAAFGASGHRVADTSDLDPILRTAIAEPGVSVIDCPLDYSINERLEGDLLAGAEAFR